LLKISLVVPIISQPGKNAHIPKEKNMSKAKDTKKEVKKKPGKSLKEKRAAKKEKRK
jgi:hypothetical protein